MRCLHCGNRISLLRKLKDSEFCSDEHRDFYALQQQQMAVSRLMETSSPRHQPLPGLKADEETDARALPKGVDRRGLPVADSPAPRPSRRRAHAEPETAAAPETPAPAAQARVAPEPPVRAAAPAPAAPAKPVAPAAATTRQIGVPTATQQAGYVSQFPTQRDWAPRRWRSELAEAVDFNPVLAVCRLQNLGRRKPNLARMKPLSGSHEWCRAGVMQGARVCEPFLAPSSPTTFSEILSLFLHGFICEQALGLDLTPCQPPEPVVAVVVQAEETVLLEAAPLPEADTPIELATAPQPELEPELEPQFNPLMPVSAEAGLGASQLPRLQPAARAVLVWFGEPVDWRRDAVLHPVYPFVNQAEPVGKLPEIDWTAERLDQMASRHEPGLTRLRSPRARSPQMARLVKPATGNSGPPIRVRPVVRPPNASPFHLSNLAMPSGLEVPLRFDRPVAGQFTVVLASEDAVDFLSAVQQATRPGRPWTPGIGLGQLRQLVLCPSPGLALTEAGTDSIAWVSPLALPPAPFVRGNEFDPPACGLVQLTLAIKAHRTVGAKLAAPSLRPVISYKWSPIQPELLIRPEADWTCVRRSMVPLSLAVTAPKSADLAPSGEAVEPVGAGAPQPDFANVRFQTAAPQQDRSSHPMAASRMLPITLDEAPAKPGSLAPKSTLEQLIPKPAHQLGKSPLRTQADWERNRWTSASMYGSAIWRIAIGRFSGALDQAPKVVRWVAAVSALALGAFAIYPGAGPSAPDDMSWTMANKPGPEAADARIATKAAPPRRPRAQPAPAVVVPPQPRVSARVTKQSRGAQPAPAADRGQGLSSAWENVQRRVAERAAVAFTDDFRNGLAEWEGAGDWARSWSYDASGFVRTGGLAVLAPAHDLTDYRMEFLGQIERRSMGWVVRAADLRNYYALKLTIVSEGPVPEVALIRYPVINGMAGAASQQMLPIEVRSDTVYRVQTEVRGDYFAVTVQGKVVDSWTDARLKKGSIGLFSGKGELARVRWVGVWHQYDTLGRLCALLAPGGLPGRERGEN